VTCALRLRETQCKRTFDGATDSARGMPWSDSNKARHGVRPDRTERTSINTTQQSGESSRRWALTGHLWSIAARRGLFVRRTTRVWIENKAGRPVRCRCSDSRNAISLLLLLLLGHACRLEAMARNGCFPDGARLPAAEPAKRFSRHSHTDKYLTEA